VAEQARSSGRPGRGLRQAHRVLEYRGMTEQHTVVILKDLRLRNSRGRGTLYYYAGNFFWPVLSLDGCDAGKVTGAIRRFIKANRELVETDRSRADYLTIEQLCDLEPEKVQ